MCTRLVCGLRRTTNRGRRARKAPGIKRASSSLWYDLSPIDGRWLTRFLQVSHGGTKNDWWESDLGKKCPSPSHQWNTGLFLFAPANSGKDINNAAKPVALIKHLIHWYVPLFSSRTQRLTLGVARSRTISACGSWTCAGAAATCRVPPLSVARFRCTSTGTRSRPRRPRCRFAAHSSGCLATGAATAASLSGHSRYVLSRVVCLADECV